MKVMNERVKKILDFWFIGSKPEDWFKKNDMYDKIIRSLFWEDYNKATNNEYDDWQDDPNECLALVILLDQFSRNLFRNSPMSFEQDKKARLIVNEAVDRGYLEKLSPIQNHFLLLPLIHSEDISDHIFGHQLINTYLKKLENFKKLKKIWEDHTNAIKKFGRYPHRNKILGRKSTKEEEIFLTNPNTSW